MTISYGGFSNSPCAITRGIGSDDTQNDAATRKLRVSNYGQPTPVGFFGANYTGNFDNPVFFKKMLAAAMQLTGFANTKLLSNVTLGNIFWLVPASCGYTTFQGSPSIEDALHALYPDGELLDAPFFESFAPFDFTSNDHTAQFVGSSSVTFEDTAGAAQPNWLDINLLIEKGTATDDSGIYQVKLFHTLTT